MTKLWMVWRYLRSGNRFVTISSVFAIFGMMIGVAALVVSMSVVNGFEKSIHESVIDFTGHILVIKRGHLSYQDSLQQQIQQTLPDTQAISPFLQLDALFAHKGKVHGVGIRGQRPNDYGTKRLAHRLVEGEWDFGNKENPKVVLGIEFKRARNVMIGDEVRLIVPKAVASSSYQFNPSVKKFRVAGFIDLGKFDYNERIILTDSAWVQDLQQLRPNEYNGLLVQLSTKEDAAIKALKLNQELGSSFYAKDWFQHNRNFLSAVAYEKYILFVVLSVMLIAASINVSSSLFIAVLKRFNEIAILKSIGASKKFLLRLFTMQGIVVGLIGTCLGLCAGLLLCKFIEVSPWFKIPAEIYKLDHLPVDVRWIDVTIIFCVAVFISYLSTLLPASRGAGLNSVEGLRYE